MTEINSYKKMGVEEEHDIYKNPLILFWKGGKVQVLKFGPTGKGQMAHCTACCDYEVQLGLIKACLGSKIIKILGIGVPFFFLISSDFGIFQLLLQNDMPIAI